MRGRPIASDYDDEFIPELLERLQGLLGPTWAQIQARDLRGRQANPPNPARHPLAVLADHAILAAGNLSRNEFPGNVPDLLALTAVVEILNGARHEPVFDELVRQLGRPEGYRHNMLVLGMVDLLRRYTPYQVRLFPSGGQGARVVDFEIEVAPDKKLSVETKGPVDFDGPRRTVTRMEALNALRKVWRKATAGPDPQLGPGRIGFILTGGVTLNLESLPVVVSVAGEWLRGHGARHPEVHAIAVMTYIAVSHVRPTRMTGAGPRTPIRGTARTQFAWAFNPHYAGPVQIRLTPAV